MSVNALRMFIPITKVDAAQRLVYGIATGETLDRSGEVCDYASTKPFYEKWSGDIAKSTGGKSLGNVRAMHGKVAAGKVTSLAFNDDAKQIEIAAKIVDDAEWAKVEEGVYTGFSQGGGYVKRWKDEEGLQRYTADPSEVSLVDLPCLPEARFEMIKADGSAHEWRHFKPVVDASPSNADITAKATELAKAADRESDWAWFIEPAREALVKAALPAPPEGPKSDPESSKSAVESSQLTPPVPGEGLEQVWKAKDGATFAKKADAIAHNAAIDANAAIEPTTKAVTDQLNEIAGKLGIEKADPPPGQGAKHPNAGKDQADGGGATAMNASAKKSPRIAPDGSAMKALDADGLQKNFFRVARLAEVLATLKSMQESAEVDALYGYQTAPDSDMSGQMKAWISQGCVLLIAIIQSESDLLTGDVDDDMLMAAGAKLKPSQFDALDKAAGDVKSLAKFLGDLEKKGARNSKADQDKIQAMHDHSCDLGATCNSDNCDDDDVENAYGARDLTKAVNALNKATAERDALQKAISNEIVPMLKAIGDRVENIERQPLPLPFQNGRLRVAEKGGSLPADVESEIARLQKEDPEALRLIMHKVAQSQPMQMTPAR